ncbi:Oxygen-insensitive NAD(P)H nitroreductase (EC / Dihydropteridine reductase (EC [Olavius algarvensis Delta 1 endosymbiont]|nr:Oxygen-insensitive NAD(P)H nitroreductase (EC / Dihydropteridine reductase (EC [Olavius algarvensis Delta 1 endosymbiont]
MKDTIIEAFNYRHACKEFDPEKKISDQDFEFILNTGRLSPSSFGFEPWKFLVVQNQGLREKLKEHAWGGKKQIPTSSHLLVILARKGSSMKYDSQYMQDFMKHVKQMPQDVISARIGYIENFQRNDFKLLESERAIFDWACRQTYISLANMMTAASMIGIDSCPMEGFHADKINAVLEKDLGIDTQKFGVACMVAFGYRKTEPAAKTRQSLEQIVTWYD